MALPDHRLPGAHPVLDAAARLPDGPVDQRPRSGDGRAGRRMHRPGDRHRCSRPRSPRGPFRCPVGADRRHRTVGAGPDRLPQEPVGGVVQHGAAGLRGPRRCREPADRPGGPQPLVPSGREARGAAPDVEGAGLRGRRRRARVRHRAGARRIAGQLLRCAAGGDRHARADRGAAGTLPRSPLACPCTAHGRRPGRRVA